MLYRSRTSPGVLLGCCNSQSHCSNSAIVTAPGPGSRLPHSDIHGSRFIIVLQMVVTHSTRCSAGQSMYSVHLLNCISFIPFCIDLPNWFIQFCAVIILNDIVGVYNRGQIVTL